MAEKDSDNSKETKQTVKNKKQGQFPPLRTVPVYPIYPLFIPNSPPSSKKRTQTLPITQNHKNRVEETLCSLRKRHSGQPPVFIVRSSHLIILSDLKALFLSYLRRAVDADSSYKVSGQMSWP